MSDYVVPEVRTIDTPNRYRANMLVIGRDGVEILICEPSTRDESEQQVVIDAFRLFAAAPGLLAVVKEPVEEHTWCSQCCGLVTVFCHEHKDRHRRVYLIDAHAADAAIRKAGGG